MTRSDREVVTRLGTVGLSRALSDVLDQPKLIRLANAVGLAYPGMRTRSQKRSRLVADLTEKAAREDAAGLAVIRALRKETSRAVKEWSALSVADRASRLTDPAVAATNGRLGTYIFLA